MQVSTFIGRMISTKVKQSIYEKFHGRCANSIRHYPCPLFGRKLGVSEWQVDHIKEKSLGGSDHPDNLQLLCGMCHNKKTNRFMRKNRGITRYRKHEKDFCGVSRIIR